MAKIRPFLANFAVGWPVATEPAGAPLGSLRL
jgi:hypothetical protein